MLTAFVNKGHSVREKIGSEDINLIHLVKQLTVGDMASFSISNMI